MPATGCFRRQIKIDCELRQDLFPHVEERMDDFRPFAVRSERLAWRLVSVDVPISY
jgi:hypothetical protein